MALLFLLNSSEFLWSCVCKKEAAMMPFFVRLPRIDLCFFDKGPPKTQLNVGLCKKGDRHNQTQHQIPCPDANTQGPLEQKKRSDTTSTSTRQRPPRPFFCHFFKPSAFVPTPTAPLGLRKRKKRRQQQ
ncbi:hypothetical protein TW95_gp1790 [Pandoravirus inopinatum]|uniref:Uncharacterized protein n=1 Tax=Pandoravirus inopinatum TaxID=1605721 RepID=A0A0B5J4G1_9VIRU|nr:hypothetical protein TW95_gp1790 [Pandoravirus inopinatum]AJF98524.1 hypothetical protein [Pandoravirus inopinatum]